MSDTRDELKARAHREEEDRRAVWNGEPLPAIEHEGVTRADVITAATTYANLCATAHGMPAGSAAWGNLARAYCHLQDVLADFGRECATSGEVL